MKIKYVEIANILSVQSIRLDFQDNGLVLLDGWNYDDDTANGAGKTAILNSISYGIFGKFPRKISASDILRSGTKSGHVKVGIEVGECLYEVYRARPNVLKFYIDGLEKDMTQEEFEGHIRMTYTQYLISMYSAQTEGLKLISMNDSGKKDFFLQLMNLDAFEECREIVTKDLAAWRLEESKLVHECDVYRTKIETYEESKVDIETLEKVDPALILSMNEELLKCQELSKPDTRKVDALEAKVQSEMESLINLESECRDKRSHLSNMTFKRKSLISIRSETAECPYCNKMFCLDERDVSGEVREIDLQMESLKKELEEYPDFMEEKTKLKGLLSKCKDKRSEILETYHSNRSRSSALEKDITRLERVISITEDAIKKNRDIDAKIGKISAAIADTEFKVKELSEKIKMYEAVQGLFSSTGAPAYVLDSAVDVFNDKVYQYASMIWPNASYVLQSFRENKSGEVKAKFSEKLTINGKDRSIGALSGGEYRCLSLAVDFAVVDVLETMFGISINPMMLDEPFNDLDASNRERVLEMLEKVSAYRQVWVVDHATEVKAMFSSVVRVEKRNGISSVVI